MWKHLSLTGALSNFRVEVNEKYAFFIDFYVKPETVNGVYLYSTFLSSQMAHSSMHTNTFTTCKGKLGKTDVSHRLFIFSTHLQNPVLCASGLLVLFMLVTCPSCTTWLLEERK